MRDILSSSTQHSRAIESASAGSGLSISTFAFAPHARGFSPHLLTQRALMVDDECKVQIDEAASCGRCATHVDASSMNAASV